MVVRKRTEREGRCERTKEGSMNVKKRRAIQGKEGWM